MPTQINAPQTRFALITPVYQTTASDRLQNDKTALFDEWDSWENNAVPGAGEQRDTAVAKMKDCYERGENILNLEYLNLNTLPDHLPRHVTSLCAGHNRLKFLPESLPEGLTLIDVSENELSGLPASLPVLLEELNVSHNQLRQLPDDLPVRLTSLLACNNRLTQGPRSWPGTLTELMLDDNRLAGQIEKLPDGLIHLDLSNNQLTQLGPLPSALRYLAVSQNQLAFLPPLPARLREFQENYNQLVDFPRDFPDCLERLELQHNLISRPLVSMPKSLKWFIVNHNRLTQLCEQVPPSVIRIEASNNLLTFLPELPGQLRQLHVESNQLTDLPPLPGSLNVLDASNNLLTRLPPVIAISRNMLIILDNNPLSEDSRQTVSRLADDRGHRGAQFHFSMTAAESVTSVKPIEVIFKSWYPAEQLAIAVASWQAIAGEDGAPAFLKFLDRLSETGVPISLDLSVVSRIGWLIWSRRRLYGIRPFGSPMMRQRPAKTVSH